MHKFDPAHADCLLSPERRRMQDPDAILDAIDLSAGMAFADVGCGPGYFIPPRPSGLAAMAESTRSTFGGRWSTELRSAPRPLDSATSKLSSRERPSCRSRTPRHT